MQRISLVESKEFGASIVREESGRDDAGVVENKAVTELDVLRELGKFAVGDRAALAVDDEHARGSSVLEWVTGDELVGKIEVKITGAHDGAEENGIR